MRNWSVSQRSCQKILKDRRKPFDPMSMKFFARYLETEQIFWSNNANNCIKDLTIKRQDPIFNTQGTTNWHVTIHYHHQLFDIITLNQFLDQIGEKSVSKEAFQRGIILAFHDVESVTKSLEGINKVGNFSDEMKLALLRMVHPNLTDDKLDAKFKEKFQIQTSEQETTQTFQHRTLRANVSSKLFHLFHHQIHERSQDHADVNANEPQDHTSQKGLRA